MSCGQGWKTTEKSFVAILKHIYSEQRDQSATL